MSLVYSEGETPQFGAGTRLFYKEDHYRKAGDTLVNSCEKDLGETKNLEEVSKLLKFLDEEGLALVGSRGYVYSLKSLSAYIDRVVDFSKQSDSVSFMWNMFPRSLGLRKKIMEISNCSENLINKYH